MEADFRHMPFAEQSFDIVLSSLAIHNVKSVEEREKTLREIIRVLKPNGQFAILDFQHVKQYAAFFQKEGMDDVRLSKRHFMMFPPVCIVSGRKGNAMW
ncbi:MAG TPA: class I SAM-dependent methyltransferase [Pseudogracilibacillus sp.]|nr:class I SAM-dependent methyltransferase [Pseudogracilibacillus sp.]